jgi:translation initiation factor IF-3
LCALVTGRAGPGIRRGLLLTGRLAGTVSATVGEGPRRHGNKTLGGHISVEPRVNEQIRAREVRLVGPEGEQVGIVPLERALQLAADVDLDLVEVAPMARPPVCKLMDFGKYKYESALKAREARRNQQQTVIKEMKLRPKIDSHDYETKKGHVVRFLKAGDKVKVTIMFRGREQSRPELGFRLLRKLSEEVAELGFVEAAPKQDGRNMIMVLAPHRATKVAASDAKVASAEATKTAAAAAKATHREAVSREQVARGNQTNGGTPAAMAQTVNAAAAADRGAGES